MPHHRRMHAQNLTALAVLLAAAVACGLAMSRARLPAAAGFILVGVALGPSGAALIKPDDSIATLAELGVLMLLFIIGTCTRKISLPWRSCWPPPSPAASA